MPRYSIVIEYECDDKDDADYVGSEIDSLIEMSADLDCATNLEISNPVLMVGTATPAQTALADAAPELLDTLLAADELLNNSSVRDFIGRKLGEQARLHRVLNATRAIIAKAGRS